MQYAYRVPCSSKAASSAPRCGVHAHILVYMYIIIDVYQSSIIYILYILCSFPIICVSSDLLYTVHRVYAVKVVVYVHTFIILLCIRKLVQK